MFFGKVRSFPYTWLTDAHGFVKESTSHVVSRSASMSIASHQEDEDIAKHDLHCRKVGVGKAASQHVLHVLSCVGHSKARVAIWHGVEHVEVVLLVGQPEINKNRTYPGAGQPFYMAYFPRCSQMMVFSFSDNCTGVHHHDGSCFFFCRHTCSAHPSPQLAQLCKAEAHVLGNQHD